MKKQNKNLIILIVFMLAIAIGIPSIFYFTAGYAAYSNTQQLYVPKDVYPHTYPLDLTKDKVLLSEGINFSNVEDVSITLLGCQLDSEDKTTLSIFGIDNDIRFSDCGMIEFKDGDGEPYIHFKENPRTIKILPLVLEKIKDRNINYIINKGSKTTLKEITLTITERVICTRSSFCQVITVDGVDYQSRCDPVYHKCTINTKDISGVDKEEDITKVVSDAKAEGKEVDIKTPQGEKIEVNWWLVSAVMIIVLVVGLLVYFTREKK